MVICIIQLQNLVLEISILPIKIGPFKRILQRSEIGFIKLYFNIGAIQKDLFLFLDHVRQKKSRYNVPKGINFKKIIFK